ncbi:dynamin family protein-like protein [Lophiostoma macrostomum CBS 122681]|uniref:Dynamin family protein-like protein n=1 Tax=Lophiostoma macrostomum CBS 122681 TaxID=1314788 RepID=A0A6A6T264_9PLEO|nr:dynamin family protein-like protein [Lophiostoma macrostomum CBS 122681]
MTKDTATPPSTPLREDATLTTASLAALQSDDQRKVMDIVDKLRRSGLNGIVGLPQIIVSGDQSSGKSSVLEAITEIPFPRKENLCTRFATEIILRRSPSSTISVKINPDKNRSAEEQAKLKSFTKTIEDFSQLPEIIDDATSAMGLGQVGAINSRAFSRDVLSIVICGPDRPQLTLVDLPGLIHATNKAQTESDKELIINLVKDYMRNPRTIILAVVSAKNDFANQIILDHCKKIDEKGERTLGVNIYLKLGWHMLRNRSEDQMGFSFEKRNEAELLFFSKGRYNDLPRENVGIDSLRQRLSKLLLNHLKRELPSLKDEMSTKLVDTMQDIEALGEKRSTVEDQRIMLMKISIRTHDLLGSAIKGYYEDPFFGTIDMHARVDSLENLHRLRAVVQHLNMRFAENVRLRGHKFAIGSEPGDDTTDEEEADIAAEAIADMEDDDNEIDSFLPKPKELSGEDAISWVMKVLERTRGQELSGNFNAMLIAQLFREQSQPWEGIAKEHISNVFRVCKQAVYKVIQHTAPAEFRTRLATLTINANLAKALEGCNKELKQILEDKTRPPMTYNHYFTTIIQQQRQRKQNTLHEKAMDEAVYEEGESLLDRETMERLLADSIEQNMDKFSSQEALNTQRAYYKDEMKYFVNVVCKQVIERHLVDPLPRIILSPMVVTKFTDEEVQFVAAEPPEITRERAHLEDRKAMLENGMETFREAMGGLRR